MSLKRDSDSALQSPKAAINQQIKNRKLPLPFVCLHLSLSIPSSPSSYAHWLSSFVLWLTPQPQKQQIDPIPLSICCQKREKDKATVPTFVVKEHSIHDIMVSDHGVGLQVDLHHGMLGRVDVFYSASGLTQGNLIAKRNRNNDIRMYQSQEKVENTKPF